MTAFAQSIANAILSYKKFAYFFPNANPLFPHNEYPNQLFGTSLKLNHASISLGVSPCVALVYKK